MIQTKNSDKPRKGIYRAASRFPAFFRRRIRKSMRTIIERSIGNWERRVYGGTITHFRNAGNRVALTFDDGPGSQWTQVLLDLLKQYKAKATFFLVGSRVAENDLFVNKMIHSGHAVANHTWSHVPLPGLGQTELESEVERCESVLQTKNTQKLFRPPFGHLDGFSRRFLLKRGYRIITWNIAPGDWEPARTAEEMMGTITEKLKPGSILLLHDLIDHDPERSRAETVKLLKMILERYSGCFSFNTLPELIQEAEPVLSFWNFQNPEYVSRLKQNANAE